MRLTNDHDHNIAYNNTYNIALTDQLKGSFRSLFGRDPEGLFFAPGRINLIGEHTDYNGGHVFPCALSMGTYGAVARREDPVIRMFSLNFPEEGVVEVSLEELRPQRTGRWTSYPEGIFWVLREMGYGGRPETGCGRSEKGYGGLPGADLMFAGDLPAGSGLSSSASLEVVTALMIRESFGLEGIGDIGLARIGQAAENRYNGIRCGIMDQFASAMGRKDHAICLDTGTLNYEYVPLRLDGWQILITDSRVKHSLASSAYNDRRRECARALDALRQVPELRDLRSLCQLGEERFARYSGRIPEGACRMRAEHAVREEARTAEAVKVLRAGDIPAFGRLMNESHRSLRDLYQVSCPEIDYLAETAWQMPGVAGSRLTGGGFGGCTISIVRAELAEGFMDRIRTGYEERFQRRPAFYRVDPGEGARKLDV